MLYYFSINNWITWFSPHNLIMGDAIVLTGGVVYFAIRHGTVSSLPLETITLMDAIQDVDTPTPLIRDPGAIIVGSTNVQSYISTFIRLMNRILESRPDINEFPPSRP